MSRYSLILKSNCSYDMGLFPIDWTAIMHIKQLKQEASIIFNPEDMDKAMQAKRESPAPA